MSSSGVPVRALRTFVAAKLHGLRVTDKSLEYNGSATLPRDLMEAVGIEPYEQVHCVNKHNGERWVTYAIPGPEGEFALNGAAARKGEIGDECLVFTYRQEERFSGALVAFVTSDNRIERIETYEPASELV